MSSWSYPPFLDVLSHSDFKVYVKYEGLGQEASKLLSFQNALWPWEVWKLAWHLQNPIAWGYIRDCLYIGAVWVQRNKWNKHLHILLVKVQSNLEGDNCRGWCSKKTGRFRMGILCSYHTAIAGVPHVLDFDCVCMPSIFLLIAVCSLLEPQHDSQLGHTSF